MPDTDTFSAPDFSGFFPDFFVTALFSCRFFNNLSTGILLGLLLLAILLVLFCPVRYKASAVKAEGGWKQTEGEGIVSWLFHGISLRAEWKDQQMEISFHLFGIPVDKLLKKRQEKRAVTKKSGAEKVSVSGIDGNREEEHKKSVVDYPKSESIGRHENQETASPTLG